MSSTFVLKKIWFYITLVKLETNNSWFVCLCYAKNKLADVFDTKTLRCTSVERKCLLQIDFFKSSPTTIPFLQAHTYTHSLLLSLSTEAAESKGFTLYTKKGCSSENYKNRPKHVNLSSYEDRGIAAFQTFGLVTVAVIRKQ